MLHSKKTVRARVLRSNPTDAEKLFWSRVKSSQLGVKFRRQYPVGVYFVDFFCSDRRLAVEIDGGQHGGQADQDRTEFLASQGIEVLRFWNNDVLSNIDGVLQIVVARLEGPLPPLAPPSRRRERGGLKQDVTPPARERERGGLKQDVTPPAREREGGQRGAGDPALWRAAFPALEADMNGRPLAFLDSGASAQKPQAVLDKVMETLSGHYANIHRGLYQYSQRTTAEFEAVRGKIARFINAPSENEIVFTRNSTEAINLVAYAWGQHYLHAEDEIILTEMEHHANIVPWHLLRDLTGIVIKYIPVTDEGELDLAALDTLLTPRTKLVSFVHVSNALGTVNPAKEITARVKAYNPSIKVLVDGSQSAVHMPVDMRDLGCDWFVLTGHKLYGPTGVGVLWGREDVLSVMHPYQGGGDMIERVRLTGILYRDPPQRFEAGTPAIVEVIGLGAAIDFIAGIGWDAITAHEKNLSDLLYRRLAARDDVRIIGGGASTRAGIVSFLMKGAAPADVGMILDQCGVAVRTGHHCCQPLMDRFGVEGTVRASLALYNNEADIDALMAGLDKAAKLLS